MSRSTKTGDGKNDGIGDEKAGSRTGPHLQGRSKRQGWLIADRRSYGSTEKILRRNRKTWTRMFSKEGRRLDKQETEEQRNED